MSEILLGVTGSVAAYRACDLARDLMRAGHSVQACLTRAASTFVTPVLFESLTGRPCLVDVFEEPERGRMAHIDLARRADLLLVAPATADFVNKLAAGTADDMLSSLALVYEGRTLVAPAMNPSMYAHPATRTSLTTLVERGAVVVEPTEGDVACGENGQGKLASNAQILDVAASLLQTGSRLKGRHVLITSGPTVEALDDVRQLTNRSSGKMGAALAHAALLMGAEVTVVTGPTSVPLPLRATIVRVESALEMLEAAKSVLPKADIVVGAAAVADYRPESRAKGKMRRTEDALEIRLVPNPDVIATLAKAKPEATVVAFAAEPGKETETARQKLERKGVAAIAMNDISDPATTFGSDVNELTLLFADGSDQRSGRQSKLQCALWLFDQIADYSRTSL